MNICSRFLFSLHILFMLAACNSKKHEQVIEFKKLEEMNYTMDSIVPGTPLKLIAYSGGIPSNKDVVYYYQFIGVDEKNNDTVRILSAMISYDDEKSVIGKIYTPTSEYDPSKRKLSAEFYPQDSIANMLINLSSPEIIDGLPAENLEKIKEAANIRIMKEQLVAVNKSIDIFENNYKTVIGVLHFSDRP